MTAGFLNESGDFVATMNEREISGCPLCGKAPFLAEDEHFSFRLYCGKHQNICTLWYSSLEKAEIEWDRIVKNHPINYVDEFTDRAGDEFLCCPYCQEVPAIKIDGHAHQIICTSHPEIHTSWLTDLSVAKHAWNYQIKRILAANHPVAISKSYITNGNVARKCFSCGSDPVLEYGADLKTSKHCRVRCHCLPPKIFEWCSCPQQAYDKWNEFIDNQHDNFIKFISEE